MSSDKGGAQENDDDGDDEMDSKDLACAHLMCWNNNELVACARIKPPDVSYDGFSSIGRVVNKKKFKWLGIGKELLTRSIDEIQKSFSFSFV